MTGHLGMLLTLQGIIAASILISLSFYLISGGADFGGGVWDMLASGPRKNRQRELIEHSIEPIWEANHVWLILVITVLYTGFPRAFATIATFLHIPLLLMLIGIVLRGAAFIFRTQGDLSTEGSRLFARVFSVSSLITPILLGIILGAVASGNLPAQPHSIWDFIYPWLGLFPLWIGVFTLSLVAYLSAVYLTVEAERDQELQQDFQTRALYSAIVSGLAAAGGYAVAARNAPFIWHGLYNHWWTWPPQSGAILLGVVTFVLLWLRRFRAARICAAIQVILILWGWGLAQFPYLVFPRITIFNAGAAHSTLTVLLISLIAGAALLFPSLGYLYWIFKGPGRRKSRTEAIASSIIQG